MRSMDGEIFIFMTSLQTFCELWARTETGS